jgi:hypothetical protein
MTTVVVGRSECGGWLIGALTVSVILALGVLVAMPWVAGLWVGHLLGIPGVVGTALVAFACYVAWRWVAMFVGKPTASNEANGRAHEDSSAGADLPVADGSQSRSLPHVSIPFEISRLGTASTLFDALTEFDRDLVDQWAELNPEPQNRTARRRARRRVKRVLQPDRELYEFRDAEIGRVSIHVPGCGLGCCPSRVDMEVSAPGSGPYQATLDFLNPCDSALRPSGENDTLIELGPGDVWIDETGRRFRLPIPVVLAVHRNSNEDPALVCLGTRARPFRGAGADDP